VFNKNGHDQMPFALITGGSTGIGKAFAIECARNKKNVAMIALPDSGLEEVARELEEKYNIVAHYLNIDLTEPGAAQRVYEWSQDKHLPVDLLVNNAGVGFGGAFEKTPTDTLEKLLQLNINALTLLTHRFIPVLKQNNQGYIINLSSMSGLHPVPYKTIYAASKSYVYYFSQGLREELKNESVNVSVVCPGPVLTNGAVAQRVKSQGVLGKIPLVTAEKVARSALKGARGNRVTIIPGWVNQLYGLFQQLVPVSIKR
jgi:short-subunit dehydrogenase